MTDIFGEGLIQRFGFFFQNAGGNGDSGIAQTLKPFTGNQRIGILHAGNDAADPGRDDGVGASSGAALMRARFEVDVKSCAAGLVAGLLQGQHFSVLDAGESVRAFADDPSLAVRQ